jgi:hypothetical protein
MVGPRPLPPASADVTRSVIGEPVADAVHGEHVPGLSDLWFDLAAEALQVGIDRPLI